MRIPSFVIKFQDFLLGQPEGSETKSGRIWVFETHAGEVTVTEFIGERTIEYILMVPSKKHPSEVYGINYDPLIHGEYSVEEYEAETEQDVATALQELIGTPPGSENDLAETFPNFDVSYDAQEEEWTIDVPNSDIEFLAKEGSNGWNAVFINGEETETGGPFQSVEDLKRFVYVILSTMRDKRVESRQERVPESPAPRQKVSSRTVNSALKNAANKIASACDDIDVTGYTQISDVLMMALEAIQDIIEQ